jgi:hypothetical protein
MKPVPRFFTKVVCRWCNIKNTHYIDFALYLPKEDKVFYTVTCSYCYKQASKTKDRTYNYTRYECTAEEWNNFIPKIEDILN